MTTRAVGTTRPGFDGQSLEVLAPGARALVDATKHLLITGGMDAVRIDKIAAVSGQNRAMVRYYFGNKAALVARVVDELMRDQLLGMIAQIEGLPEGEARIAALVDSSLDFTTSPEFAAFYDVLPTAVRDADLRARIAELYDWYRRLNRESLDPSQEPDDDGRAGDRLATLATIFLSSMDGLLVQKMLDPEAFDKGAVGSMWKAIIRFVLESDLEDTQPDLEGS